MTTITTRRNAASRQAAFTLAEILMAAGIGSFVLAGVISSFMMLTRSGINIGAYAVMDAEARRALETISQDLRMASALYFNHAESVTLTVPDSYTAYANKVTYTYDGTSSGATAHCLYQRPGDSTSTAPATILMRNVTRLEFRRFDRLDNLTTSTTNTKRLEFSLTARTTANTVVAATDHLISASYILRNKPAN